MTIDDLKSVIENLTGSILVRIHEGWDWTVAEYMIDPDDGFILFADIPDEMKLVDRKFIKDSI